MKKIFSFLSVVVVGCLFSFNVLAKTTIVQEYDYSIKYVISASIRNALNQGILFSQRTAHRIG